MRLKLLLITIAFFVGVGSYGQMNYVSWNFATSMTSANYSTNTTNQNAARTSSLTTPTLSTISINGTGISGTGANTFHRSTGWPTTLDNTKYLEFSITLANGQTFNNTSLNLLIAAGVSSMTTAPRNYLVQYGWGSSPTFATVTGSNDANTSATSGGAVTLLTTNQTPNNATIPAPGNTTSTILKIRLIAYGSTSGSGNIQFGSITLTAASLPSTSDTTAPTVTTFSPLDGATAITVNSNLLITFNENVVVGTAGNIIIYNSDNSVFETIPYNDSRLTFNGTTAVTINPTGTFANSAGYYVQIGNSAIRDVALNNYAGIADTTTWNFTTLAATPTITASPTSLTGFTYVAGSGPSVSQSFSLSGANLTEFPANITVSGSANYEVSTNNSTFSGSVTVSYSSATLTTTPIYIRLKTSLSAGNYNSETISITGGGDTDGANATCSGSVSTSICGSESFANICTSSCSPANSNYGTRSWTGDGAVPWTATQARTDQTITGSAITINATGVLTSSNYSTGIGNLTFKTKFPFGETSGSLTIAVNGTPIGTVAYGEMNGTTPINKVINGINVSGNIVLTITSATARFTIDDISWTCYTSCTPTMTTPTAVSITTTTATLGGNITSIGCSTVTTRGVEWSTTSGFANGSGTLVSISGTFATEVFTQAVTGLPSGTVIYYKAFATNTEGTGYSTQASFTTPITNDLCSGAIDLTINAVAKSAVMNGSTTTAPFTEKDVWFSFTPSCSGTHNITVTGFSGDIDIELYSVACPVSKTYFDTSSGTTTTETITNSLTAGTTYYLRVLAFNTTAETTAFSAQVNSVSTLTINNTGSPAAGLIITGTSNAVLMGFTNTPNCATSYNLTAVTISKTGTSTTSDISNLRIFYDANSNGIIDGVESSVSGTGIALATNMTFTLSGQTSLTTTSNYLLVADVSASAIGGNTFIGKITNSTNLSAVLTPTGTVTGTASGNTQTITYSGPEINVTNNTPSGIPTGSVASTGFNTQFAATAIGSSTAAKTYRIYNLGSTTLNVSAVTSNNTEFTVTSSSPYAIAPGAYVTFTVIFSPLSAGLRTALISIANDDITNVENPYTFNVKGDGTCVSSTNTITPTSGPIGTEVTINSAANLTGAIVSFNGIATTVIPISSTQIKFVVPTGATSGNLVTTNALGCSATNAFTVIENATNSCQGGSIASDLFISEVTDESFGSMTYIEIFNGTGASINLTNDNYRIKVYNNGSGSESCDIPLSGTIANNSVFVLSIGGADSPEAGGVVPNQTADGCFAINSNDNIRLFKGALQKDQWGFTTKTNLTGVGAEGYTLRRKNTATPIPSIAFDESHWDVIDADDDAEFDSGVNYSDIGTYNFILGTPPTVTIPTYTATCKTATLTISGTEGFTGGNPLTYQWLVSAPNATGWTEIADNTNYSGSSSATLSIANISTIINYQYYCQIRENTNTCYTASNAVKIINGSITWNGTDWRDVNNAITIPSLSKLAVINSNYNTATNGDLNACSVIVNAGKVLTVTAQKFVTIQNDLTINPTGKLEVLDKGSLVMINDSGIVTNNGTTYIQRKTTDFELYDYTYWSTPIASTDIETTFTTLPSYPTDWRIDNAYEFIPANYMDVDNDGFDDNNDDWSFVTSMIPGKGYIIMVPERPSPFPPYTSATVIFSGKVNNGSVTTPIALTPANIPAGTDDAIDDFNLVGNPYPSAISADAFINANISTNGTAYNTIEGTLYFWTHKKDLSANNLGPDALNYSQDDYAVYTLAGGTGTSGTVEGATEDTTNRPNGYIASGQGFFVEAVNPGTLLFNNVMRVGLPATANSQFFKSRPGKSKIKSKDRIWLNLSNSLGMFSQQLVGYFDNTTLGYDNGYDGLLSDAGNYIAFYSFIDDKTYKIQGRTAYDENDQVRLGYFSAVAGTFNINIDSKEGVFANLSTPVYLEDKLLNVIYDLKQSPYTFTTEKGTFNDRFILRYTNKTLGTADLETLENQVLVSNKNKQIKVNSAVEIIDKVLVYDLLGRQLFKKEKVNSNELTLTNFNSSQKTLLVKVSLQNGQTVTRKVMY